MKKSELIQKTDENISATRTALQTVVDNLNKGQKQKLIKAAEVKTLFERYGVEIEQAD